MSLASEHQNIDSNIDSNLGGIVKILSRLFLAASLGVTAVAVVTPPSSAGSTAKTYSLTTPLGGYYSGQAKSDGTVTFYGGQKVEIAGWIKDICDANGNGDGAGAYIVYEVRYMDGHGFPSGFAHDTNGCGNGKVDFGPVVVQKDPDGSPIRNVLLRLSERDANSPERDTVSVTIDNPYT